MSTMPQTQIDRAGKALAFEEHNFFRALDWRWQTACRAIGSGRRASRKRHDPATVDAVRFLTEEARCRTARDHARLAKRWAALTAARHLASSDGPRLWEVRARILASHILLPLLRHPALRNKMMW